MAPVAIQQTQPLHQIVWSNVLVMGTVEQPLVQQSKSVTTIQPIVEVTLTCAYCNRLDMSSKIVPLWMIN